MAQSNFSVANGSGLSVRTNLNAALQALATLSSGATAPSTTYASQLWWDTANNLLMIRNGANSAWVTLATWNGTSFVFTAVDADTMLSDVTKRITANMGFTPVTDTSSSGAVTFDFATGNIAKITLSENITSITLSGATAGDVLEIWVTQEVTGSPAGPYTVTGWPAAVKWSGGTAYTASTTDGAVDIIMLRYDGTNYFGSYQLDHQ